MLLQVPSLSPFRFEAPASMPIASRTSPPAMAVRQSITREGDLYRVRVLDSTGNLFLDGTYLDPELQKPHGTLTINLQDGSRQLRRFHRGLEDGTWEKYFSNGQLEEWMPYSQGRRDGAFVRYYSNGTVSATGLYQDGLATGTWTGYYADGKPRYVSEYVMNDLITIRYYTRSGLLIEDKPSGLLDRKGMVFFDDRLEKESELRYSSYYGMAERLPGGRYAFTLYTMEGAPAARVHFTDRSLRNKTGAYLRYDELGNTRISTGYRDNQVHGLFRRWYSNGNLSDSGTYEKGRRHGVWMTFYPDGALRDSGYYHKGLRDGLWTVWEREKNIRSIGLFRDGMREGNWKFYAANTGKILFVRNYHDRWRYGESETIDIRDE
jgi:antitoxin component YwqK of YwqJK toxin-antitoxin module